MNNTKGKIGLRQALVIFFLASVSPLIRLIPSYLSETSKQASWVAPIVSILPLILLILVLNIFFSKAKKRTFNSLEEVLEGAYGKVITKGILILYTIWIIILCAIQVRLIAERYATTLFFYSSEKLFVILSLVLVYFALKGSFETLARFSEIGAIILLVILSLIAIIAIQNFDVKNVYPVTFYDSKGIMNGMLSVVSIFSSITYIFFMGDIINDKEHLKRSGKRLAIWYAFITLLIVFVTIGCFGYKVVNAFTHPFFIALKSTRFMEMLEGVDGMFVSLWLMMDFFLVSYYLFIATAMIKKVFKLKSRKTIVTPLIFLVYILSFLVASSFFELTEFSSNFLVPINLIFGFGIIIITYLVLKLRKIV